MLISLAIVEIISIRVVQNVYRGYMIFIRQKRPNILKGSTLYGLNYFSHYHANNRFIRPTAGSEQTLLVQKRRNCFQRSRDLNCRLHSGAPDIMSLSYCYLTSRGRHMHVWCGWSNQFIPHDAPVSVRTFAAWTGLRDKYWHHFHAETEELRELYSVFLL